jgi:hypothetical protein
MTTNSTDPITADPKVKEMYALGEAGDHHRRIAAMVGEWDVVMNMYPGPGEKISSVGMKSRKRAILDGRQIMEEIYEGTMGGVPHRKVTMLGYNAVNQRYEFVTADNLDTQQMSYHGTRDPKTGVIELTASYTQAVFAEIVAGDGLSRASGKPASRKAIGGIEMTVRDVLTIASNNEHKLQMYFHPAAGEEGLGAEYLYRRAS